MTLLVRLSDEEIREIKAWMLCAVPSQSRGKHRTKLDRMLWLGDFVVRNYQLGKLSASVGRNLYREIKNLAKDLNLT